MIPDINKDMIAIHVRGILTELGYEPDDPHFKDTPKRVAKMFGEILDGNFRKPEDVKARMTVFEEQQYKGMIVVTSSFYSFCAHHMAMFSGRFALGYIPHEGKVLGLSKLVRIFREGCRHLTTQEAVTQKAVNLLHEVTGCPDIACVAVAEHSCMSCRGVQAHDTHTTTQAWRGAFEGDVNLRREFLSHFDRSR